MVGWYGVEFKVKTPQGVVKLQFEDDKMKKVGFGSIFLTSASSPDV
jgi:hypothetical protein